MNEVRITIEIGDALHVFDGGLLPPVGTRLKFVDSARGEVVVVVADHHWQLQKMLDGSVSMEVFVETRSVL